MIIWVHSFFVLGAILIAAAFSPTTNGDQNAPSSENFSNWTAMTGRARGGLKATALRLLLLLTGPYGAQRASTTASVRPSRTRPTSITQTWNGGGNSPGSVTCTRAQRLTRRTNAAPPLAIISSKSSLTPAGREPLPRVRSHHRTISQARNRNAGKRSLPPPPRFLPPSAQMCSAICWADR